MGDIDGFLQHIILCMKLLAVPDFHNRMANVWQPITWLKLLCVDIFRIFLILDGVKFFQDYE